MSEGKKVEGQEDGAVSQSEDGGRTYELNLALALAKTLMKLHEAAKDNPAKKEGLQKFDDLDPEKQKDFVILSRHHRVPQDIKDFIDGFGTGSEKFRELVGKVHEEDEKALGRDPEAKEYFQRVGIGKENGNGKKLERKKELVPIPIYDPEDQVSVHSEGMEITSYTDPEIYTVSVERTKALRTMDPERSGIRNALGGDGLKWAIDHIDMTVGRSFDAHGFGLKIDPVEGLDTILRKGFNKDQLLYTTQFIRNKEVGAAIGADHPFTEGGIILISDVDKKLVEGVRVIIVGEEYCRAINILKNKYPNYVIVPWHDAPKVLTELYNGKTGEHRVYEKISKDNRPTYAPDNDYLTHKGPVEIPQAQSGSESQHPW